MRARHQKIIREREGKPAKGTTGYTGDLSKWWRSKSAQSALRRATKVKKLRIKKLRETMKKAEKKAHRL